MSLPIWIVLLFIANTDRKVTDHDRTIQEQMQSEYYAREAHKKELENYKSIKPTWQMDGQERHDLDEAWKYMSPEEQKKQLRRDFGDLIKD